MLTAPAGIPADIIDKLKAEIAAVLKSPDSQKRTPALDFDLVSGDVVTPAGAKRFFDSELATTGKVIQEFGIQPE